MGTSLGPDKRTLWRGLNGILKTNFMLPWNHIKQVAAASTFLACFISLIIWSILTKQRYPKNVREKNAILSCLLRLCPGLICYHIQYWKIIIVRISSGLQVSLRNYSTVNPALIANLKKFFTSYEQKTCQRTWATFQNSDLNRCNSIVPLT